jgi:hypothetical protein
MQNVASVALLVAQQCDRVRNSSALNRRVPLIAIDDIYVDVLLKFWHLCGLEEHPMDFPWSRRNEDIETVARVMIEEAFGGYVGLD